MSDDNQAEQYAKPKKSIQIYADDDVVIPANKSRKVEVNRESRAHNPALAYDSKIEKEEVSNSPDTDELAVTGSINTPKELTPTQEKDADSPKKEPEASDETAQDVDSAREPSSDSKEEGTNADVDDEKKDNEDSSEEPQSGIVNELAERAAGKKQQKEDAVKTEAHKQNIDKLVEDKTYNVPIGQISRRRNTRLFALFIVVFLLLVAAGIYYAKTKT